MSTATRITGGDRAKHRASWVINLAAAACAIWDRFSGVSFATWALPRLYRLLRGTPSVRSSTAPVAISPYSLA